VRSLFELLERLAGRKLGALVLFTVALAVYAVESIGWPLIGGRDLDEYLYGYIQFLDWHPLLPWSMLFRTPATPIVAGAALDLAGGFFAEPLMAVLFAGSVVAWAAAARAYSPRAAILVSAALLVYPAYGLFFHELSSDALFAASFALWAWLLVRAATEPSARRFALAGAGVALCALVRPGNAILLLFAAFAGLVAGTWRDRLKWASAFLVAGLLPLVAWSILNGERFGYWGLARGGNAVIPFYRAFITDKIVAPQNGPASRRLAAAVQHHLLTREPYKSYGVTLHKAFSSGSFRIHEDLYLLSDQVFGWDSNYSVLRKAGIEAVRKHPGAYASGVGETVWQQLSKSYFRSPPPPPAPAQPAPADGGRAHTRRTRCVALDAGQPVPGGLDVSHTASRRLPLPARQDTVRPDHSRARRALRRPAGPKRQRTASAPPESGVPMVSTPDSVARNRSLGACDSPPAGSWRTVGNRSSRVGRDPVQRAGAVRGPAVCASGCPCVRSARRRGAVSPSRNSSSEPARPSATTTAVAAPPSVRRPPSE
jgi:dolichyl-phosphate-mannose-protein mannosyltransferase